MLAGSHLEDLLVGMIKGIRSVRQRRSCKELAFYAILANIGGPFVFKFVSGNCNGPSYRTVQRGRAATAFFVNDDIAGNVEKVNHLARSSAVCVRQGSFGVGAMGKADTRYLRFGKPWLPAHFISVSAAHSALSTHPTPFGHSSFLAPSPSPFDAPQTLELYDMYGQRELPMMIREDASAAQIRVDVDLTAAGVHVYGLAGGTVQAESVQQVTDVLLERGIGANAYVHTLVPMVPHGCYMPITAYTLGLGDSAEAVACRCDAVDEKLQQHGAVIMGHVGDGINTFK